MEQVVNGLPMSVAFLPLRGRLRLGCEILEQHAVHEDVSTTDFAQKDASSSIVEEANVIQRGEKRGPRPGATGFPCAVRSACSGGFATNGGHVSVLLCI
jgi:hypothetical protein